MLRAAEGVADEEIAETLHLGLSTGHRTRQRFVNEGLMYGAFPPDEARRITRKLEFHYTPKHGSWLNMAECELAVLAGQCLNRRISTIDALREEIAAWEGPRNQRQTKIRWQFTNEVARAKLKRLYPSVESTEDPVGPEAS